MARKGPKRGRRLHEHEVHLADHVVPRADDKHVMVGHLQPLEEERIRTDTSIKYTRFMRPWNCQDVETSLQLSR